MKHLFLLFSFVFVCSMSANAQACNKSASAGKACCASKSTASAQTPSTTDTKVASALMEADVAVAASNGAIMKRTCEMSGSTSYFEKSVCGTSGKVSWEQVEYDSDKKSFTKVASASMEKDENGAKVTKKACAGMSDTKACCKKDGAKTEK
ncbi:MAG: hypothetical protein WAU01_09765 [Saprospiraceae bacterium]